MKLPRRLSSLAAGAAVLPDWSRIAGPKLIHARGGLSCPFQSPDIRARIVAVRPRAEVALASRHGTARAAANAGRIGAAPPLSVIEGLKIQG